MNRIWIRQSENEVKIYGVFGYGMWFYLAVATWLFLVSLHPLTLFLHFLASAWFVAFKRYVVIHRDGCYQRKSYLGKVLQEGKPGTYRYGWNHSSWSSRHNRSGSVFLLRAPRDKPDAWETVFTIDDTDGEAAEDTLLGQKMQAALKPFCYEKIEHRKNKKLRPVREYESLQSLPESWYKIISRPPKQPLPSDVRQFVTRSRASWTGIAVRALKQAVLPAIGSYFSTSSTLGWLVEGQATGNLLYASVLALLAVFCNISLLRILTRTCLQIWKSTRTGSHISEGLYLSQEELLVLGPTYYSLVPRTVLNDLDLEKPKGEHQPGAVHRNLVLIWESEPNQFQRMVLEDRFLDSVYEVKKAGFRVG